MNEADDTELRRLLQEASEALLRLSQAVHRRSVRLPHGPIAIGELAAMSVVAHVKMIQKLKEVEAAGLISSNFRA